jgi:4-hydroxysphinganine ceramide fatty acyl 2-hydroxylase
MVNADWSWDDYMEYINEPKYLVILVRDLCLFDFVPLELATKNPAWLIPITYIPLMYWCWTKVSKENSTLLNYLIFVLGFVNWTMVKYGLHRFLFHTEDKVYYINNHYFYIIHFLMQGIHQALPNDHYKIVFPSILGYPVWYLNSRP